MINGCYVLHLYCRFAPESDQSLVPPTKDNDGFDARHYGGPREFIGETGPQARRAARRAGWKFGRDGDVTCPKCLKNGPGTQP
jgi:hypothetical protein